MSNVYDDYVATVSGAAKPTCRVATGRALITLHAARFYVPCYFGFTTGRMCVCVFFFCATFTFGYICLM